MEKVKKIFLVVAVAALMISAGACKQGGQEGPAQQTGKEIDKAVGEAGQKMGEALEKAGEAMKEAGKEMKEKSEK